MRSHKKLDPRTGLARRDFTSPGKFRRDYLQVGRDTFNVRAYIELWPAPKYTPRKINKHLLGSKT